MYNLFNRTPTPLEDGWSVRKTQVTDFRGGTLTYDSHNGTDFAVPVGTVVVAPAPGKVLRISSEFNRGGLKVFLDHGRGCARRRITSRAFSFAWAMLCDGATLLPCRGTRVSTG